MFIVLYSFHVKEGQQVPFIEAWEKLTKLIYQFEGSYGSRLHKVNSELYIGYVQWPDRKTWSNSGKQLPENTDSIRTLLRDSCTEITTEYEMTIVKDLLQTDPFK